MPFHPLLRLLPITVALLIAACERTGVSHDPADPPAAHDGGEAASPAPSPPAATAPASEPEPAVTLGYTFKDGKVWYLAAAKDYYGDRQHPQPVEGADPASFMALPVAGGSVQVFGKDAGGAYYQHRKIAGADPATFGPLGAGHPVLALDARRVYFKDTVLCEGAANFRLIGTEFATNGEAIFQVASGGAATQDVGNFRLFHQGDGSEWHRDGRSVWCDGVQIIGADPATFRVLGKHYALDARRAYFWTEPIPEADVSTFEVVDPARKDDPLGAPVARDARLIFQGAVPSPRTDR